MPKRRTHGTTPHETRDAPRSPALAQGQLYEEPGAPSGYVRFFAVDAGGARCFEVGCPQSAVTDRLLRRWSEDALALGGRRLSLVP